MVGVNELSRAYCNTMHPLENNLTLATLVTYRLIYPKFDRGTHLEICIRAAGLGLIETAMWSLQFINLKPISSVGDHDQSPKDYSLVVLPIFPLSKAYSAYFLSRFTVYVTIFELNKLFKVNIVEWLNLSMVSTEIFQNIVDISSLVVKTIVTKKTTNKSSSMSNISTNHGGINIKTCTTMPIVLSLLKMIGTAIATVYFSGFRVELALKNTRIRGVSHSYPILMRPTNVAHFVLLQRLSHSFYQLVFEPKIQSSQWPFWKQMMLKSVFGCINVGFYGLFSYCVNTMGNNANNVQKVADELKRNNLVIPGYRSTNTVKLLNRYIPTMAATSGVVFGSMIVVADMLYWTGNGDDLAAADISNGRSVVSASNVVWSAVTCINAYVNFKRSNY